MSMIRLSRGVNKGYRWWRDPDAYIPIAGPIVLLFAVLLVGYLKA